MVFGLLYCCRLLRQILLGLDVGNVGSANVDCVGDLHKEILCERCGESDRVEFVLSFAVGHEDRDKRLGDVPSRTLRPPGLPEREQRLRTGRGAVGESVSLEVRPEYLGVVKHFGAVLFSQRVALGPRIWSCVYDRAAERGGIYVVVNHLDDEAARHGVEDLLGVGVGVTLGEHNLLNSSRPKQLGPLDCRRLNKSVIEEDPAAVEDRDCFPEDRDRPVINLDIQLVIGRRRMRGGAGSVRGELLDYVLDVFLFVPGGFRAERGTGSREGTGGSVGGDGAGRGRRVAVGALLLIG